MLILDGIMQKLFSAKDLTKPHSTEAERSILGAILIDYNLINQASALEIKVETFYHESHRRIYAAMLAMWRIGTVIDLVTLSEELRRNKEFEQVGGATYIAGLIDGVPQTDTIEYYAKIIISKALLRELISQCNRTIADAMDEEKETETILEEHERAVFQIAEGNSSGVQFISIGDASANALDKIYQMSQNPSMVTGIPTGLTDFDNMTGGLHKENSIIIAAETSYGKSTLAMNWAQNAAKLNYSVGVFSLEMSTDEITQRYLAGQARIDASRLQTAYINNAEWDRLYDAIPVIANQKLFIQDNAGVTVDRMRASARRLAAQYGLDLLIIDYMQLIQGRGKTESRAQEMAQVSRDIKLLAKELHIPIVTLSQFSRSVTARNDHRPRLSDLKETSGIEQDADMVCFIYKESKESSEAELIVEKNRNGKTGTVMLAHLRDICKFESLYRVS
jgi:replicative DNA helicase